jgi:hypothetical protein
MGFENVETRGIENLLAVNFVKGKMTDELRFSAEGIWNEAEVLLG